MKKLKRVTFAITYIVYDNVDVEEEVDDDDAITEASEDFANDLPMIRVKDFGVSVEEFDEPPLIDECEWEIGPKR